ncbi:SDR family NAD(P)-dependent oxidoreductase [Nitrospirillum iridis]|uniref:NAD(P)-dependent dehydrogenase (Short-subunit alcohol dehydrogenase family) n=1 Tax=Nitrospirillum iridis TaxID=765888 RepID=A0A7X0B060_9PROT|nr:SDR family oxidoreductase [Nitrospirillum iridis]MBB6253342.1 NAD(P)-dependent dehydrogenase (short-subunit alcohol dehydrogenase family) [Nitrospirillum iridis]
MAKTIVITGAGTGLGREVARELAADGHILVLLGRTLSKLEKVAAEIGGGAYAVACDVSSADSVRDAFAVIAGRSAAIDVLINNAAVYQPFLVKDASDEQILSAVMTNYVGPIYCVRAAIPMMGKGGHVINVSSESVGLPFPMFSLYQSSKAGLERFSEALSAELAVDGIRVTTVRAGQMMGEDMTWNITPEVAARFGAACARAGLDLRSRPISHFSSPAKIFRQLIDLPPDLNLEFVHLQARHR